MPTARGGAGTHGSLHPAPGQPPRRASCSVRALAFSFGRPSDALREQDSLELPRVCAHECAEQAWWQEQWVHVDAGSALSPCAAVRRGEWPRALSRASLAGLRLMRDRGFAGSDRSRPAWGQGLGPPNLRIWPELLPVGRAWPVRTGIDLTIPLRSDSPRVLHTSSVGQEGGA